MTGVVMSEGGSGEWDECRGDGRGGGEEEGIEGGRSVWGDKREWEEWGGEECRGDRRGEGV